MATGRVPTTANSPLTTKGDLFTYDTSQARLAVGSNGETLVADSSTSTGLRWQSGVNGNGIINGGFDIWQRGTSFTGTNNYTADRWQYYSSTSGRTITRQTTSDTTNLPFIQYAIRLQRDSGNSNTGVLTIGNSNESVESYKFAGRTVVLSFYARAGANYSASSSGLGVFLKTGTGTDQNVITAGYTGSANTISQTATLTTTWQRFSYSASLPSTTTEYAVQFEFTPTGTAGANDWCEITGVQVELGATPSAFKRAGGTLAGELAACQRYYFRYDPSATGTTIAFSRFGFGSANSTGAARVQIQNPTTMRVGPSTLDYNTNIKLFDGVTAYAQTSIVIDTSSPIQTTLFFTPTSASLTAFRPYWLYPDGNTAAFVGLSSEL